MYGILERQFRRYYQEAARRKGNTGEHLLMLLESRLDNVVYRMGFGSTRAEARQLVGQSRNRVEWRDRRNPVDAGQGRRCDHRAREGQEAGRIQEALSLAEQTGFPSWSKSTEELEGKFKAHRTVRRLPRTSTSRSSSSCTRDRNSGKPAPLHGSGDGNASGTHFLFLTALTISLIGVTSRGY